MENTKASGMSSIFAALYGFFIYAATASYIGVYAYMPDFIGADLVAFSASDSVKYALTAALSFVAAQILAKIGPKLCMIVGGALVVAAAALVGIAPSIVTWYVMAAVSGVIMSVAGFGCMTDAMVKIYGADSPSKISFVIGAATVGMGVGQGVAGAMYEAMGMKMVFLGFILACGALALASALPLRIPKAAPQPAAAQSAAATASASTGGSVFKDPAIWCIFLAMLLLAFPGSPALLYATSYFPSFGAVSISTAALMVSAMGILTGLYNMVSGTVMAKFGQKPYTIFIVCTLFLLNAFALMYGSVTQMWVLVLVVVAYIFAGTAMNLPSILAPALFGTERTTDIVTKGLGFSYAGNIIAPVALASIVQNMGFAPTFMVAMVLSVVMLVIYIALFAIVAKRGN